MSATAPSSTALHPVRIPITLDRTSPVPLYHQLYEQLADAIRTGQLRPGDPFEQELALVARTGLSRLTVRRALADLVHDGLVVRGRGVGTVVADNPGRPRGHLESIDDEMRRGGGLVTTRLLRMEFPHLDPVAAHHLRLADDAPMILLERLRLVNGCPAALLRNRLPATAANLRLARVLDRGLYAALRAEGVAPVHASQTVVARRASAAERRLLDLPREAPVLALSRVAVDGDGSPVEYGQHCFRVDAYSVRMDVDAVDHGEARPWRPVGVTA